MSYWIWEERRPREMRDFAEKAYERKNLKDWDAKWQALSMEARKAFLNQVKIPIRGRTAGKEQTTVPASSFDPGALKELVEAGFVVASSASEPRSAPKVTANADLHDFADRVRALDRFRLLSGDKEDSLKNYINYTYYNLGITSIVSGVLVKARLLDYPSINDNIEIYIKQGGWPGWVGTYLKEPLAERIFKAVAEEGGSIFRSKLLERLNRIDPDKLRVAVDRLVTHLALVEDLEPKTLELKVGFLPAVYEQMRQANQPRKRPPLITCEQPTEFGPEGSLIVNDLRAFLLEVVSDPPRIRQDGQLYQRELERFGTILEPLPAWFMKRLALSDESRLNQAHDWAAALGLIEKTQKEKQHRIQLTRKGEDWLSTDLGDQLSQIYHLLNAPEQRNDIYESTYAFLYPVLYPYSGFHRGDARFLGQSISIRKVSKGKHGYRMESSEEGRALRAELEKSFSVLEPGVFYRLDSVLAHFSFEEHNPLNLGLPPGQVKVYVAGKQVPALNNLLETTARGLLEQFIRERLIPLGCLRAAVDAQGGMAIARLPRLDAYFGRKVSPSEMAPASSSASQVIIQPDFSVIVIGLNAVPVAELGPFCERALKGGSQGSMVLKITRDSVVKAVSLGLKPDEIVARLKRHATNEVPANVLKEVRHWSDWVREVELSTITVLRCPDAHAADRVMAVLKQQAERINETLIGIDALRLTPADRTKLRSQGVLVVESKLANVSSPPKRKKKRRY